MRREVRMQSMKDDKRAKGQGEREKERDVSESIALGKAVPKSKDGMFDQRLFNQDQGLSSALGGEDEYNVYDKALFKGNTQNYIYRQKVCFAFPFYRLVTPFDAI
jgi:SNW domain-containing protein 1